MLRFIAALSLLLPRGPAAMVTSPRGGNQCSQTVLYIPLDERFTTRDAFLNLAKTTGYCILTPDPTILPSLKVLGDVEAIQQFVDDNAPHSDAMIVSAEMFLYGGLIASRISNDTTATILSRARKLLSYSSYFPDMKVYVSNVVMRIPAYDGDFEEPWYWADYGFELYTYSFYLDKYSQSNDAQDLATAKAAVADVPHSAVEEFVWRRERNHNVTMFFLQELGTSRQLQQPPPFHYFYTTLDDSAEYGFNIREAEEVRDAIQAKELPAETCPVYPGADEVHLTMLAKLCVNTELSSAVHVSTSVAMTRALRSEVSSGGVTLAVIFRDPSNIEVVPGYEGQPMIDTLQQQIAAAGGVMVDISDISKGGLGVRNDDLTGYDAFLLVNNFSEEQQEEASNQSIEGRDATTDYAMFDSVIQFALTSSSSVPLGFCDNRYANGGDILFKDYMAGQVAGTQLYTCAYAGWNTNGNTIGTVVSNAILLSLFGGDKKAACANAAFNGLRLLEDVDYQAKLRQDLKDYANSITNVAGESSNDLGMDLDFYTRYAFKSLSARFDEIAETYGLDRESFSGLQSAYFPWNRTFEIGLVLN